jgi:PTS system galactitol-specific IIA component
MSTGVFFSEELIFRDLEFSNREEALKFLSSQLRERGYVKEEYQQAILEREKEYPTGLPSVGIKIAIPHADHTLVNTATLAVGVLKNPVEFMCMDDPDKGLDVSIIVMLALNEPHGHIEMLQRVVKIIKAPQVLKAVVDSKSSEQVMNNLKPYLIGN